MIYLLCRNLYVDEDSSEEEEVDLQVEGATSLVHQAITAAETQVTTINVSTCHYNY